MSEQIPETMSAWRVENGEYVLRETQVPSVPPGYALIRVKATSLNRGEIWNRGRAPWGRIPGLEAVGIVVRPADGIGPTVGTRVLAMTGFRGGGWAEYIALPANRLGVLPDEVGWSQGACLATAALTAFHAVKKGGLLLGARVLITDATGAVGRYAAQLAALAGAEVTGLVPQVENEPDAAMLGLHNVVLGHQAPGPFDFIVDTLGDVALTEALKQIAPHGVVAALVGGGQGFGATATPASIPLGWEYSAPNAKLVSVNVGDHVEHDIGIDRELSVLGKLARDKLRPCKIGAETDWRNAAEVVGRFIRGEIRGKAVLQMN